MALLDFLRNLGAPVTKPLDQPERSELARYEDVIRRSLASYAEAGAALAAIRDKQLYRETHATFDEYLSEKWRISAQHAARIISAANVAANLSPMGKAPATERQARLLVTLPKAEQLDAWQEAEQLAGGGEVQTSHIAEAVNKRRPKSKRKAAKPITIRVPGASVTITPNKAFTTAEAAITAALDWLRSRKAA